MPNSNQAYVCPVCRYPDLDEPAYDSFGCASYNIRPCCGTEFGYDDSTIAHSDLRGKWVSEGMQWWSKHKLRPNDWGPVRQLKNNQMLYFLVQDRQVISPSQRSFDQNAYGATRKTYKRSQ